MDLFGPTTYASLGDNKYCLVIVDDFSRHTWTFFLQDKAEVASIFKKFAKNAQNQFHVKIKKIRSDNGKEFDNTNIEEYCDEVGIKHEFSSTYTLLGILNIITKSRLSSKSSNGAKNAKPIPHTT